MTEYDNIGTQTSFTLLETYLSTLQPKITTNVPLAPTQPRPPMPISMPPPPPPPPPMLAQPVAPLPTKKKTTKSKPKDEKPTVSMDEVLAKAKARQQRSVNIDEMVNKTKRATDLPLVTARQLREGKTNLKIPEINYVKLNNDEIYKYRNMYHVRHSKYSGITLGTMPDGQDYLTTGQPWHDLEMSSILAKPIIQPAWEEALREYNLFLKLVVVKRTKDGREHKAVRLINKDYADKCLFAEPPTARQVINYNLLQKMGKNN